MSSSLFEKLKEGVGRAFVSTIGVYSVVALALVLGAWVTIGAWQSLGAFSLVCIITGPFVFALAIYILVQLWIEGGLILRIFMLGVGAVCVALVGYGVAREGMSLLRWGGVVLVAVPALAASTIVSLIFVLLPVVALGSSGFRWLIRMVGGGRSESRR
jgi:hypothetical protein